MRIAAAPASFGVDNQFKAKYVNNEFAYVGAGLDENIDIGLKEKLSDDEDSGDSDDLADYFSRNKKAEEAKRLEQTRAYYDAAQAHDQTMNPDMSRLDRTMPVAAIPEEIETPTANGTIAG